MNIVSWKIRGCNHPRKIKTLSRKVRQERSDFLFLYETKCNSEVMETLRKKIWKRSRVMETNSDRIAKGVAMLWHPNVIDLSEWRANHFSLMANFRFLETGVKSRLFCAFCSGWGEVPLRETGSYEVILI